MRLTVENVGALGPLKRTFDFAPGLTVIVGRNGSGKSTLANSLYFPVTGDLLNGENLSSLISWGTTAATVSLELDGIEFSRTINKTGTAKVKIVDGETVVNRRKEADQYICDYYGFVDKSVFKAIHFAEQFKAINFIEATDSDRVDQLSTLFGFSRLEKIRAGLHNAANTLDTSKVNEDTFKALTDAVSNTVADRDFWISTESSNSAKILTEDRLAELNKIINAPEAGEIDSVRESLQLLSSALAEIKQRLFELPDHPDPEETAKYKTAMSVASEQQQLAEALKSLKQLEAVDTVSSEAVRNLLDTWSVKRAALIAEREAIVRRGDLVREGKCPITAGVPCPDLSAMANPQSIQSALADIDVRLNELDKDIRDMTTEFNSAVEHERELASKQSLVSYLQQSIEAKQVPEDFDIQAYEARVAAALASMTEREELTKQQAELSVTIKSTSELLHDLELRLEQAGGERTKDEQEAALAEIREHNEALAKQSTIAEAVAASEGKVKDAETALDFAVTQNSTAEYNQRKVDVLNKVRTAFHRDNLPRMLVMRLLEVFNAKLSTQLRRFNFPYDVTWSATGSLTYTNEFGDILSATQLSGGQKYVLAIAIRCAMADLVKSDFPVFVLDEPTTGLDTENRQALADVLVALSDGGKKYVIVPTHDELLFPDATIINL